MAIKQYDKIIAQEINNNAATSFNQGALIYASDIAGLYGGSDKIEYGALIRAEHFQNLGLPNSGGLNGTFNGMSFKDADNNSNSSGFKYVQDDKGWTLYITKGGTINFTNFGIKGSTVDIFMIGGGGAGNKDGGNGGGGQPITKSQISLSANRSYTLTIGAGATSNGGNGGETYTTIFSDRASGGKGGVAGKIKYALYNMWSVEGSKLFYANSSSVTEWERVIINGSYPREMDFWLIIDENTGLPKTGSVNVNGMTVSDYVYRGRDYDYIYAQYSGVPKEVQASNGSNGSQWTDSTYCFGNSSWWQVGGLGPNPTSTSTAGQAGTRYGQGGGGNYNKAYGGSASAYGAGKSGIIAIRNWRQ